MNGVLFEYSEKTQVINRDVLLEKIPMDIMYAISMDHTQGVVVILRGHLYTVVY